MSKYGVPTVRNKNIDTVKLQKTYEYAFIDPPLGSCVIFGTSTVSIFVAGCTEITQYCGLRVRPCDYTKIPRITKKNCFRLLLLCSSLSYRWHKSMLYSSDITPFIWDTAMLFAIWIFTFRLARIVISIKIALLQRKHNLGLVNLCQDLILCWHAVSFPLA